MKIKLIATDLDGTLFNAKSEIPQENILALREAVEAGIVVAPCSGRCPVDLAYVLSCLGIETPKVAFNGAIVMLPGREEPIYEQPMPQTLLEASVAVCMRYGAYTNICTKDLRYLVPAGLYQERALRQQENMGRHGVRVRLIEDFAQISNEERRRCLKILTSLSDPDKMAAMRAEIEALPMGMTTSASFWDNVEVMAPNVNKGQGILRLCEALSIAPEEVMVLGDAENDLSMFRVAGFPVAMGNAMDCVKAAAKAVTLTNEACGVAAAIRRYAVGRGE